MSEELKPFKATHFAGAATCCEESMASKNTGCNHAFTGFSDRFSVFQKHLHFTLRWESWTALRLILKDEETKGAKKDTSMSEDGNLALTPLLWSFSKRSSSSSSITELIWTQSCNVSMLSSSFTSNWKQLCDATALFSNFRPPPLPPPPPPPPPPLSVSCSHEDKRLQQCNSCWEIIDRRCNAIGLWIISLKHLDRCNHLKMRALLLLMLLACIHWDKNGLSSHSSSRPNLSVVLFCSAPKTLKILEMGHHGLAAILPEGILDRTSHDKHFWSKSLIPSRISAFARPTWTNMSGPAKTYALRGTPVDLCN